MGLKQQEEKTSPYSSNIYPIKVKCIGQLSSGVILKTLEHGADGILIIGCSPGECHFRFGNKQAETIFSEAKSLALLLGYQDFQLRLSWISKGDGLAFVEEVQAFIEILIGSRLIMDDLKEVSTGIGSGSVWIVASVVQFAL